MRILVIGFEPGYEGGLHQVRIATETIREVVCSQFNHNDYDEKIDVITYVIEGDLNVISRIYAKAQIEVLNPDAVLLVTYESTKEYQVMRYGLRSIHDEEEQAPIIFVQNHEALGEQRRQDCGCGGHRDR